MGLEVITSYQQCSQQQASQQQGHQHQLGVVPPTRSRLHHISLTKQTSKRESSVHIVSVPGKGNHSASSKPNASWDTRNRLNLSHHENRREIVITFPHITVLSTVTESVRGKKKNNPTQTFLFTDMWLKNWQCFLWLQGSVKAKRCQLAERRGYNKEWLFGWNAGKLLERAFSRCLSNGRNEARVECERDRGVWRAHP